MRFFADIAPDSEPAQIWLDEKETRHAVSVFRVKAGKSVDLFDGKGRRFLGTAGEVLSGRLRVDICEVSRSVFPSPVFSPSFLTPFTQLIYCCGGGVRKRSGRNLNRRRWFYSCYFKWLLNFKTLNSIFEKWPSSVHFTVRFFVCIQGQKYVSP